MSNHTILLTVNKEVEKKILAYFKILTKNTLYVGTKKSPYSRSDSGNFKQCRNELEI
jgi:hypothetical protein